MRLLDLRGQTWWFKRAIPADCRKRFGGRTAHLVNLQTSDIRVAKRRRDQLEAETTEYFELIRQGGAAQEVSPREWGLRYREVLTDPATDRGDGGPDDYSDYDAARDAAEARAETYRGRDRSEFEDALHGRVPVEQHLDSYLASTSIAPKTKNERRGLVMRLANWCATEGLKLPDVDRREAGRYVDGAIQPMHPRTAKKHVTALRGYWEYLRRRGYVDGTEKRDNPWSDQYEAPTGRRAGRTGRKPEREFTADETRALLYGEPDAGEASQFDDVTRQVTKIGLLSGMRQGEIVTLQVADIERDAGDGFGRVFDLKASKTEAGVRKVPIHPDLDSLIDALLMDDKGRRRADSDWLFPEFEDMPDPGDTFGKRFKRFREARGVAEKREGQRRSRVNFHSARRWFITEAERARQPETTVALVVGHVTEKRDGITFGTYSGGASGAQRRACVEAVKLPSEDRQ